jgi:hypothetical protein
VRDILFLDIITLPHSLSYYPYEKDEWENLGTFKIMVILLPEI